MAKNFFLFTFCFLTLFYTYADADSSQQSDAEASADNSVSGQESAAAYTETKTYFYYYGSNWNIKNNDLAETQAAEEKKQDNNGKKNDKKEAEKKPSKDDKTKNTAAGNSASKNAQEKISTSKQENDDSDDIKKRYTPSTEEIKNILAYLDKSFLRTISAINLFNVIDLSSSRTTAIDSTESALQRREGSYALLPEVSEFELIESEKSGLFIKIVITLIVINPYNQNRHSEISAIGSGKTIIAAANAALEHIVNQFEYSSTAFEQMSDNFRIIDMYQGSAIINAGKNRGVKTGDLFYSYDFQTSKKTAAFIVERTDEKISYARVLEKSKEPMTGDLLTKKSALGIYIYPYFYYHFGEAQFGITPEKNYNGYVYGAEIIFAINLYTINPIIGAAVYDVSPVTTNSAIAPEKLSFAAPYVGLRIVRYISSFAFSSSICLGAGYVFEQPEGYTGLNYYGGILKISFEKRFVSFFSLNIDAAYSYWYAKSDSGCDDVSGAMIGGGIKFKF